MTEAALRELELFTERAAIAEYDGGLSRAEAEELASREQEARRRGGEQSGLFGGLETPGGNR